MADGSRLAKDAPVICAIGEVDELNSLLALVACHAPKEFSAVVRQIQNELFNVGAELSMGQTMLQQSSVDALEVSLDNLNENLPALKEFILPGGGLAASHCHVARSVCRRVERSLVALNKAEDDLTVNTITLAYINRLSDYLFVLARVISKHEGEAEVYWQSSRMKNEE
jgi:cob(I)alamin adenosyltransferase